MPSTADSGKNSGLRSGPDRILHIAYIGAARNKGWCPSDHTVPNRPRLLVPALAAAQQVTSKSLVERRINFFASFRHFAFSLQNDLVNRSRAALA